MLLCAQGLYPAKQTEPRAAIILPYFVRTFPSLQQKLAMPLPPHRPPLFCPLSPEAYLLTEEKKSNIKNGCHLERGTRRDLLRGISSIKQGLCEGE